MFLKPVTDKENKNVEFIMCAKGCLKYVHMLRIVCYIRRHISKKDASFQNLRQGDNKMNLKHKTGNVILTNLSTFRSIWK